MTPRSRSENCPGSSLWSWVGTSVLIAALTWLPLSGCAPSATWNLRAAHQRNTAQSRLKYELALQHFQSGRTQAAIENVNEAISAHPESPDQFLLLAQCHIELGQFVSAR